MPSEPVPLLPRPKGENPQAVPAPDLVITLRPLAGDVPIEQRLKRLLKAALRAYGFRLMRLQELPRGGKADVAAIASVQAPASAPDRRGARP